jgi:hypothetical protein
MTVSSTPAELGRNIASNRTSPARSLLPDDVVAAGLIDSPTRGLGFSDEEGVLRIASLELRKEQSDAATADRKSEEFLRSRPGSCAATAKAEEVAGGDALTVAATASRMAPPGHQDTPSGWGWRKSLVNSSTRGPSNEIESKLWT